MNRDIPASFDRYVSELYAGQVICGPGFSHSLGHEQTVDKGGFQVGYCMDSDESTALTPSGFWSAGRVFAVVLMLLWACFFLSGIDGMIAFHDREPGLPLGEHLGLYVVLPTAGLLASSGSFACAKTLPGWLRKLALLAETLLLLYVLVFWTGGM